MAQLRELTEHGTPIDCTYRSHWLHGDGYVWLNLRGVLVERNADTVFVNAILFDVTAQREAEQKERQTAQRLQTIMDNAGTGIRAMLINGEGVTYLFTNNRFYELQGYTREQYETEITDSYSVIYPEDRLLAKSKIKSTVQVGDLERVEFRIVTRDGEIKWLRAVITVTHFEGVESPVQLCVYTDITGTKENELRIRKLNDNAQTLMNDTPGGFCRMAIHQNAAPTLLYANEGFARMLAMTQDEVMAAYGADMYLCMRQEDLVAATAETAAAFASGGSFSTRCRLRQKDGREIWTRIAGRFVTSDTGEPILNSYFSDITAEITGQERQRQLLDNMPYGAALYEFDGKNLRVIHLNRKYWQLVEREPEDYSSITVSAAIHPDDRELMLNELGAAIREQRDANLNLRILCGKTDYKLFHINANIQQRDSGDYLIYAAYALVDPDSLSYQQALPLLLSAVMNTTNDFAFAKDKDFRYISASSAFLRLAGLDNERQAVGKTDYDLFPADMAEQFRRNDLALWESGKSLVDYDETIYTPEGVTHYCRASKYPLRDAAGHIIGIYGVSRDITRERSAFEQLKLVNDSVPGGIATYSVKDKTVRVVYCNDGFCQLFDGTRESFDQRVDLDPMEWVHPDDLAMLLAQIHTLVENNTPVDCVYRVKLVGGGYKWINEKAVATERRGDTLYFNAMLLDVTERQLINERLRISEEENALAVQHGGSIVSHYDVAAKTLTIAPSTAAAYSLPDRIYDVPYEPVRLGLVSAETADAYIGFFEAIQNGSKAGTVLYQQHYFDTWRWMEGKSSTIFSDDGKPVKAVISLFDVTERLEKETIYRKWQHSLADRAPDSYTLFRCNLNRNSSYETKEGDLFFFDVDNAGISFNERARAYALACIQPEDIDKYIAFLNADTMLAEYYRGTRSGVLDYRERTPEGRSRWIRLTVDLVESPNSTDVEAYLMFEDIDAAKKAELQTKELSETDPLTGLLNRTTFTARVNHILHSSQPDDKHALLMLDVDGFKQVNDVFGHGAGDQALIDLATALKSMMRREDLVARLGGDEFVVFLNGVQNENAAIAKARQIRASARKSFSLEVQISASIGIAFSPFDGVDFESLYKKADSALYFVKGSGKDNQAVYSDSMADEHLEPEPDTPENSGTKTSEKKRRMLIVDDSNMHHELLQNVFRDGFIIEKAQDGSTALIRLRHYGSAISVVLLDLMMPGMDGFAVLEKMQESAELRTIPVIMVSGDESRETCLTAIRKGATDFITKPVDIDLLRTRVHSAVSKAENERLRAQNSLLEIQSHDQRRYEAFLDSPGITFIDYNWQNGEFTYYPSVTGCLWGTYDSRTLWQILLAETVADEQTVQDLQQLVRHITENREETSVTRIVRLKTPQQKMHRFRFCARKLINEYQLANRIIITLTDLDYEAQ